MWTWTALDADSRLIISYLVGERDADYAYEFMHDVACRLANRVQLTTDGHRAYLDAVEGEFGANVDYGHAGQDLWRYANTPDPKPRGPYRKRGFEQDSGARKD